MKRVITASDNLAGAPYADNPHYANTMYANAIDYEEFDSVLFVFHNTPGQISHRVREYTTWYGTPREVYLDDFGAAQNYLKFGGSPDKVRYTIGDTTFQVQKDKKSILVSQPGASWSMPRAQAARLYEQLYKSNKGDD